MSDNIPERIGNAFTNKIGPFPGYVYIIIVAGAAYALYFWRKRNGTLPQPAQATGTVATTGTGDVGFTSAPAQTQADYSGATATTFGNAEWARNATNGIVAAGGNGAAVSDALADYLTGNPLSDAQQAIVSQAISMFGAPPEGVIPITDQSAPAGVKSVGYKVVSGDSLTSIAQQFYGDSGRWKDIFAANSTLLKGDPLGGLHGGQTLVLPGEGLLNTPGPAIVSTPIPAGNKYTIQFGDTLVQLAARFYGDGSQWQKIYNANRALIPNANVLKAGTVISIPN